MSVVPFLQLLIAKAHAKLEECGLLLAPIRLVLIWQLGVSLLFLVFGALLWHWSSWGLWIGAGGLLGTWNFFGIAKFITYLIPRGWSKNLLWGQILRLHGRLLFTAVFVYGALVWCSAPPFAVLTGLVVAIFPVAFIGFFSRNT